MDTTPERPSPLRTRGLEAAWRWRLHVIASGDERQLGRVLHLEPGLWEIGRGGGDALPAGTGAWVRLAFSDEMISREHLRLGVRQPPTEGVDVQDLASRNGTFCDGERITAARAGHGCVLRVGDSVAVLERDFGRALTFDEPWPELPGRSELARLARGAVDAAARSRLPVLVTGATGTGKEFAAAALHRRSGRRGPLVRVNIAAVPEALFESELFGAAQGAFTGANTGRLGRIAEADGGTLVLDEIGDLPPPLQAKLLRALEEGFVRPLGARGDRRVDVRFVASTNADLEAAVAAGRFRPDLLARLRGHQVQLPPLAARRADLLDLADAVVPPATSALRWRRQLAADVVEALLLAPWRFNLRDLAAMLRALARLAGDPAAQVRWLQQQQPPPLAPEAEPVAAPAAAPAIAADVDGDPGNERRGRTPSAEHLRALIDECGGNVQEMARRLGCGRRQVYRWLDRAAIAHSELARGRVDHGPAQRATK